MRTSLVVVAVAVTVGVFACGEDSPPNTDGPRGAPDAAAGTGGGGTGGAGGMGGSGGTGGGGTGGGGTGGTVSLGCGAGAGSSTCSKAELDSYNNCTYAACESQFKACYGNNVVMGTFGGPCGTFITCTSKCGCSDLGLFSRLRSALRRVRDLFDGRGHLSGELLVHAPPLPADPGRGDSVIRRRPPGFRPAQPRRQPRVARWPVQRHLCRPAGLLYSHCRPDQEGHLSGHVQRRHGQRPRLRHRLLQLQNRW